MEGPEIRNSRQQDRIGQRAELDDEVIGVAKIIEQRAVGQPALGHGRVEAGVPQAKARAAGLMALDAVGGQVRTRAIFEAGRGIGGGSQRHDGCDVGDSIGEVPGVAKGLKLVERVAGVGHVAVHLGSVVTEGKASDGGVTRQTFGPGRVVPNLGD